MYVDLPPISIPAELPAATGAVLLAVATGRLTPEEGQAISNVLAAHRQAIELCEIEARLRAVEERIGREGN